MAELTVRRPTVADAAAIHRLVADTEGLDTKSLYMYALWCRDYPECSAVALEEDRLVGVLTGYLRPELPTTYFAWQTAVAPATTHSDIAPRMYDLVLHHLRDQRVDSIEMSIDDSNRSIKFLLSRLTRRYGATRTSEPLFSTDQLGHDHHPETLHVLRFAPQTPAGRCRLH
ncbi:GNAT family N-acetyltransferase [Nocardia callitridis]|uniref:Diaminobutyrate acetyltransferase n=1 Tax=Nocardia callitridis TaxID=648753 RepID=A0ABP9KDV0_9NOCA